MWDACSMNPRRHFTALLSRFGPRHPGRSLLIWLALTQHRTLAVSETHQSKNRRASRWLSLNQTATLEGQRPRTAAARRAAAELYLQAGWAILDEHLIPPAAEPLEPGFDALLTGTIVATSIVETAFEIQAGNSTVRGLRQLALWNNFTADPGRRQLAAVECRWLQQITRMLPTASHDSWLPKQHRSHD